MPDLKTSPTLIERCSRIYTFLEIVARFDAHTFPNVRRADLRRAMADIQRIRLHLLNETESLPPENFIQDDYCGN